MKERRKTLKVGAIVLPRWFVPGYPTGASIDTRLRVVERRGTRVLCVRDDGRQGQWWIDVDSLNLFGMSDVQLKGYGARFYGEGEEEEPEEEFEEEFDEPEEPDEGDWVTTDHQEFFSDGKLVLRVTEAVADDDRKLWRAIDAQMKKDNFFPSVWFISDHGNAHRMSRSSR